MLQRLIITNRKLRNLQLGNFFKYEVFQEIRGGIMNMKLAMILMALIISIMPCIGITDEAMPLDSPSPIDYLNEGKSLISNEMYNDSINSIDQAITILNISSNQHLRKSQDALNKMYVIKEQYSQLYQYYMWAEEQYNPQSRLDRALMEAEIAVIVGMIPNPKVGPGEGVEIPIKEISSIPKTMDAPRQVNFIITDFIESCKWNTNGRTECLIKLNDFKSEMITAREDYDQETKEYEEDIQTLAKAWSLKGDALFKLNIFTSALSAYEGAIKLDPTLTDARDGKAKIQETMKES